MRILTLLDELEQMIEHAKPPALSSSARVIIDRAQVLDMIEDMRFNLPDVIRQAEQVAHQRQRILAEADAQAADLMERTRQEAMRLIDENEITRQAYQASETLIHNAQANAREVRLGAIAYADDVLNDLENLVGDKLERIRADRQELQD